MVRHALGWACWLRYARTEKSVLAVQYAALLELASGLMEIENFQGAYELLDTMREMTAQENSSRVLGDHHPLTEKIHASIELCFAEQLDWTLDDFSADLREVAQDYL